MSSQSVLALSHRHSSKLLEATTRDVAQEASLNSNTRGDLSPSTAEDPMKRKSALGGKIADRLKAFEAPKDDAAVPIPPTPPPVSAENNIPPPPPPPAPVQEVKSKRKSKKIAEAIPGSFPSEDEHPDDIIEVIEEMPPPKSKKSKKKAKSADDTGPIPPPPPPPAVPDAPMSPPPEVIVVGKKESKKERPKINRDGGSSWGMWTASTPRDKEKKSSSKSKAVPEESKKERKSRSPEKEEKLSSKGSSSDKAEQAAEKKDRENQKDSAAVSATRPKLMSVFASTPPISRSQSTREKRHREGRSSRRPSLDINSGLVSPPPEELPEAGSKAAKILGIGGSLGLGRSSSKRKKSSRPAEDEDKDIVMVGADDAEPSPERSSRRRMSKVRFSLNCAPFHSRLRMLIEIRNSPTLVMMTL